MQTCFEQSADTCLQKYGDKYYPEEMKVSRDLFEIIEYNKGRGWKNINKVSYTINHS